MLKRIVVRNYAIIDELTIDFSSGFNIITGETGAGKSILLGALGLILGQRADTKIFFNSDQKCIVEADFDISHYDLNDWFTENDLDPDHLTTVRREIQPAGKNRVFINDTPVSLNQLQELTQRLVDIHQQFSLFDLQKPAYQLELYDAYCGNKAALKTYRAQYRTYLSLKKDLETLQENKLKSLQEKDYITFQLNELSAIPLAQINQAGMEEELRMIENAGTIKQTTDQVYRALYDSEDSLIGSLENILSTFNGLTNLGNKFTELYDRLQSSRLEISDTAEEILRLGENTETDEERGTEIRSQLDGLYRLLSKHQVRDVSELISLSDAYSQQLESFESLDEAIIKLESEIARQEINLKKQAGQISETRQAHTDSFTEVLHSILTQLGMPHARLQVQSEKSEQLNIDGIDRIQFLFSANIGSSPAPIKEVASGGEISRLTLAIKSLVAAAIPLPSLIFDEIDTGLGGEIALKMAEILKKMSLEHQLIAITHSPQLAAKADKHFFVYKEILDNRTFTRIRSLNFDERVETIAVMLSTKPPTKAALENAKELIA